MNLGIEGKVFFVTGAASGIGASATEILAAAGAKVAACDRDKDRLEAMRKGGNKDGAVLPVYADISQQREIQDGKSVV